VTGTAAIREALLGFLALKPLISLETRLLSRADNLALLSSRWVLKSTGPDGQRTEATGTSTEVARQQSDGTWRFIIDTPWGLEWT
jgi:ketosteroid isomerase-like protein